MTLAVEQLEDLTAPASLALLGVPVGLAEDLFMRRVLTERMTTVSKAADELAISHAVGDEIAESLRAKQLVEYHGVEGRDYRVALTELGLRTTTERMKSGRHVAQMPVSLDHYREMVMMQAAVVSLDRPRVKQAFSDLVLGDEILDQIGPSFLSEGAIFLYGPPGTGKTSLAERMGRFFDDPILIPKFVEVDSQLISVFDPSMHKATEIQPSNIDPRYVLCERPVVMVGGELRLEMMDLQYDAVSGINSAPIQMLANNGILIVDDFGRQVPTPDEILNRWIVPLSRNIDYLKPNTGTKFTVPFELKLVISTNLDPNSLGDDAFLRRLRNKVYVGACSESAFNWILARAADRESLEVSAESAAHLCKITSDSLGELRPYVAIDFCELAGGIAKYDGVAAKLDMRLLDRIANQYFVRSDMDLGVARTDSDKIDHQIPVENR